MLRNRRGIGIVWGRIVNDILKKFLKQILRPEGGLEVLK
jgi:hypothetical protein